MKEFYCLTDFVLLNIELATPEHQPQMSSQAGQEGASRHGKSLDLRVILTSARVENNWI